MKSYGVIIIEDEYPAREYLKGCIARRPELLLRCVCTDGVTAAAVLRAGVCDLVFLDLNLPGLSGAEILRRMPRGIEVILTTACLDPDDDAAVPGPVVAILYKPFTLDQFHRAVDRAIAALQQARS